MSDKPLIVERTLNASPERVWRALTDQKQMKLWYFDILEFKAEVGFEFRFLAGSEEKKYVHVCRITHVAVNRKLAYTWRYEGYDGTSTVTFELFAEAGKTRLKLTHEGLETFPQDLTDFAWSSFEAGWTYIVGTGLRSFVEQGV